MGQLIQGENTTTANPEQVPQYNIFTNLGSMLSSYQLQLSENQEKYIFSCYLKWRLEFKNLDGLLNEFNRKITKKEKTDWIKLKRDAGGTNLDLLNKIELLWNCEIVELNAGIENIILVPVDKYYPGYTTKIARSGEYGKIRSVIESGEINEKLIKDFPEYSINIKTLEKSEAHFLEIPITITTPEMYNGEVGPELMPFPFMRTGSTPQDIISDINELTKRYKALPKVKYRELNTHIYFDLHSGHILIPKKDFLIEKKDDKTITVSALLQAVWYLDPYSGNDPKISSSRDKVTSIVVHHTATSNFANTMKGWMISSNDNSIHYFIDKDGTIVKLGLDNWATNQTAPSHWREPGISVNNYSIGIEILHLDESEEFTTEQYTALIRLIKSLKEKFNESNTEKIHVEYTTSNGELVTYDSPMYNGHILDKNIIGHSDISFLSITYSEDVLNEAGEVIHKRGSDMGKSSEPLLPSSHLGRKIRDPGLKFDWRKLEKENIGLYFGKTFSKAEVESIITKYDLKKDDSYNPSGSLTLDEIRALIKNDKLKAFVPANNYVNNPNDVFDQLYDMLFRIGYFKGNRNGEDLYNYRATREDGTTYQVSGSKAKDALKVFQVHFHHHISLTENEYNNINLSNYEEYHGNYLKNIYTISIFIIYALLRADDSANPF